MRFISLTDYNNLRAAMALPSKESIMAKEILNDLNGIKDELFKARNEIEKKFCLEAEVWANEIIAILNSKGRNLKLKHTTWNNEDNEFRFLLTETKGSVKQPIIFVESRLAQELSYYQ
jgi:hypothetical protein